MEGGQQGVEKLADEGLVSMSEVEYKMFLLDGVPQEAESGKDLLVEYLAAVVVDGLVVSKVVEEVVGIAEEEVQQEGVAAAGQEVADIVELKLLGLVLVKDNKALVGEQG